MPNRARVYNTMAQSTTSTVITEQREDEELANGENKSHMKVSETPEKKKIKKKK